MLTFLSLFWCSSSVLCDLCSCTASKPLGVYSCQASPTGFSVVVGAPEFHDATPAEFLVEYDTAMDFTSKARLTIPVSLVPEDSMTATPVGVPLPGIPFDTLVYMRVAARNGGGLGPFSDTYSLPSVPSPPISLSQQQMVSTDPNTTFISVSVELPPPGTAPRGTLPSFFLGSSMELANCVCGVLSLCCWEIPLFMTLLPPLCNQPPVHPRDRVSACDVSPLFSGHHQATNSSHSSNATASRPCSSAASWCRSHSTFCPIHWPWRAHQPQQ